jgi:transcriptional regulator with XRE-family HTH domain
VNRVLRARIEQDLTQAEVAQKAGVTPKIVRAAEQGESISPLSQGRVARALGIDVELLFPTTTEAVS